MTSAAQGPTSLCCWSSGLGLDFGWAGNIADFTGCWVDRALWLERLVKKWCVTCHDFWAAVKHSTKLSTASPNSPVVETGESRKAVLSAFFISVRFNQRWSTKLGIDLPIAWAVVFVASRARSVALRSSLKVAGSGPDSSMAWRSLAWKTWRAAIVWSAEPTCPAAE